METVNISELRANLLSYLRKASAGEQIEVTSNGEILAAIVPPPDNAHRARQRLKQLATSAVVHDVVSPIEESWDAQG